MDRGLEVIGQVVVAQKAEEVRLVREREEAATMAAEAAETRRREELEVAAREIEVKRKEMEMEVDGTGGEDEITGKTGGAEAVGVGGNEGLTKEVGDGQEKTGSDEVGGVAGAEGGREGPTISVKFQGMTLIPGRKIYPVDSSGKYDRPCVRCVEKNRVCVGPVTSPCTACHHHKVKCSEGGELKKAKRRKSKATSTATTATTTATSLTTATTTSTPKKRAREPSPVAGPSTTRPVRLAAKKTKTVIDVDDSEDGIVETEKGRYSVHVQSVVKDERQELVESLERLAQRVRGMGEELAGELEALAGIFYKYTY